MSTENPLELIKSYIQATTGEPDFDQATGCLADDAHINENGNVITGSEALDRLQSSDSSFKRTGFEPEYSFEDGNLAVIWGTATIKQVGQVFGIEPADQTFTIPLFQCCQAEGGQLTTILAIYRSIPIFRQLGLLTDSPTVDHVQNQHYEVLTRVLRHNLRNELNIVRGRAEQLVHNPETDQTMVGQEIIETIDKLLTTTEKVRTLQDRAIDRELNPSKTTVSSVVADVCEGFERDSRVNVKLETAHSGDLVTDVVLLRSALRELLDNAVTHDPRDVPTSVTVEISGSDTLRFDIQIRISDDGPGITDAELAPIRDEKETDLVHGSGVGLWVIKWTITRLHGEVTFVSEDGGGTTVELLLPDLEEIV
jgi:signal transduction histidine kinase